MTFTLALSSAWNPLPPDSLMLVYVIAPRSLLSEVILAGPYKPPPFTLPDRYLTIARITSPLILAYLFVSPAPTLTVESKLHERKDTIFSMLALVPSTWGLSCLWNERRAHLTPW